MKNLDEKTIEAILKATSLVAANKEIIDNYCCQEDPGRILCDSRVCKHLGWLIFQFDISFPSTGSRIEDMKKESELRRKGYEIGKKIYMSAVAANGNGDLIIAPILLAWHEKFLNVRLGCNDPSDDNYLSDEELYEISRAVSGNVKDVIEDAYWQRIRREYFNKKP